MLFEKLFEKVIRKSFWKGLWSWKGFRYGKSQELKCMRRTHMCLIPCDPLLRILRLLRCCGRRFSCSLKKGWCRKASAPKCTWFISFVVVLVNFNCYFVLPSSCLQATYQSVTWSSRCCCLLQADWSSQIIDQHSETPFHLLIWKPPYFTHFCWENVSIQQISINYCHRNCTSPLVLTK